MVCVFNFFFFSLRALSLVLLNELLFTLIVLSPYKERIASLLSILFGLFTFFYYCYDDNDVVVILALPDCVSSFYL